MGRPTTKKDVEDRSTWTVSKDWETNSGLINNILFINENTNTNDFSSLKEGFANEAV